MKSTELFALFFFPFIFTQLTNEMGLIKQNYVKNSINNFDLTKNTFSVLKDTSEYEKEIIYENRREIARNAYTFAANVYAFQRRTVYNILENNIKEHSSESLADANLSLTKVERNCIEKIENLEDIYFDLNKFVIRQDAKTQINKAAYIMSKCPNLEFAASSYTDSRGSSTYNKRLSQKRANAVINFIKNNYDVSAKITGIGYGESGLKNHCSNGVKCSKKQHQVNRRTEIKLSLK